MRVIRYLLDGVRAVRSWRMIVILHLLTLLVWLPPLLVFHASATETFEGSLFAESLLTNDQPSAGMALADFTLLAEPFDAVGPLVPAAMLMLLLLHVFLSGGIVEFAGREPRPFASSFFGACGARFFIYLRLLAIFVAVLFMVIGVWAVLFAGVVQATSAGQPPGGTAPRILAIVAAIGGLLLFGLLSGIHDVARALFRFEPYRSARSAFADALRIVFRAPLTILALFVTWLVAGAAIQLFLSWAEWAPSPAGTAGIIGVFLALQAALFTRSATRVAAWGSMIALTADRIVGIQRVQLQTLAEVAADRWIDEEPEVETEIALDGRLQSAE